MLRYLVVANQTLGGQHLTIRVEYLQTQHPGCHFHIVVPATPPQEHVSWTEAEAIAAADQRLDKALARFRDLGADASGEIGDANPIRAIHDALRRERFDEIILSTLPPGRSRWLKQGLPRKVEKTFGLPMTHLMGEPELTEGASV